MGKTGKLYIGKQKIKPKPSIFMIQTAHLGHCSAVPSIFKNTHSLIFMKNTTKKREGHINFGLHSKPQMATKEEIPVFFVLLRYT